MRRLALAALMLAACYFAPDKHRIDSDRDIDGSVRVRDASLGSMDSIVPADSSAQVDAAPRCMSNLDCPLGSPQCRDGKCEPCSGLNDCARFADTPVCGPAGTCVVCAPEHAQLCTEGTPACDPLTSKCVQCVKSEDCPSAMQPACTSERRCGSCTADSDCTRFGKVCDTNSGACVECRPDTESTSCRTDKTCTGTACAGTACNPKTLTCGTRPRESVSICNACDADSECVADHRCIAMTFGVATPKAELGNFCLKRVATGCPRTYLNTVTRPSVSGAAAEGYCSIDETKMSCLALLAFSKSCDTDPTCGHAPGARCETVNNIANLCTYSCDAAASCKSDLFPCGGGGTPYCGGN